MNNSNEHIATLIRNYTELARACSDLVEKIVELDVVHGMEDEITIVTRELDVFTSCILELTENSNE